MEDQFKYKGGFVHTKSFKQQQEENANDDYCITVILREDQNIPIKNFRCLNCGKILFQYYKKIQLLFEGEIQDGEKIANVKCMRCRVSYVIANAFD